MSSQYNNNKILSQPLLSIISTLNEDDLLKVFNSFISYSEFSIEKNCKITSYKCYESVYVCNGKKATGFGRNEKEANANCIRNLIQLLLSDDKVTKVFRDCLKKMNEDQQFEKISQHPAELGVQDQSKLLQLAQHSNQNQQQINLVTQSSKGGSSSGTPYQNNPNSFQISQLDFRSSYENFYSDVKNNPQHQTSVGNNNSSATPSNLLNNQSNNNQTSFQKYYNDSLVSNSLNQPPSQFVSITKSMSQPHPEDFSSQSQQQNLFTSQGDDYINHLCVNTLSSTNSALNQNLAQQQLNTSINLQTTSLTNFYNNLQHSAPKEKPLIQPFSNVSTDLIPNNLVNSISAQNKNTVQNKQSYEDAQKIAPLPQHKHSRNKSMNISGNYQSSSINLNNNPEFNALSSNFSTKSIDKDPKYVAMEEELKRSKNYIEHLERKIKLVVEENKILKSLLLENKKSSNSNNSKITNVNTNVMNTTNTSVSNLNNTYNQQSTAKQIAQTLPTNENIPPLSIQNQMQSTKQSYFLPQNMNTSSATPQYQGQNNSLLNISKTNYFTQQHNVSTSNKDQSLYLENSNKKNISMQIFEQPSNQNNILKDFNNKANIIANVQTIPETQKIKPSPNFAPSMLADENIPKITNEKIRSLSVDINAKRSTLATDNSCNKLDTSLIESGSQASKMMGHKKYKSKIPKLNLEVLPNYHGLNNKSINQQLLQQYQASQQKVIQKTSEKK
ncbi:hypothetical protein ABPG72_013421 [Tetrahymena utriculariae]